MSTTIQSNFDLNGKYYLDKRQYRASLSSLKDWDFTTNPLQEGFEIYCKATDTWYSYNSNNEVDSLTGKFRSRTNTKELELAVFPFSVTDFYVSGTSGCPEKSNIGYIDFASSSKKIYFTDFKLWKKGVNVTSNYTTKLKSITSSGSSSYTLKNGDTISESITFDLEIYNSAGTLIDTLKNIGSLTIETPLFYGVFTKDTGINSGSAVYNSIKDNKCFNISKTLTAELKNLSCDSLEKTIFILSPITNDLDSIKDEFFNYSSDFVKISNITITGYENSFVMFYKKSTCLFSDITLTAKFK